PAALDAAAFDEAEMPDVVRGAVAARDLRGQFGVLGDQHVEGDGLARLGLAEDAEVAGEALGELVALALVEMDGEPDGAGTEKMRRSAHAVRPETLAQPTVNRGESG